MPFELTIAEGKGRGQRFSLDAVDVTIGRGADNDIVLNDAGVSRNHARIRKEGQGWMLSDNGSSNGTDLNGATIAGPAQLRNGDRIGVGPILFRFEARAPVRVPDRESEDESGEPVQPQDQATRITTMPKGPPVPGRPVSRPVSRSTAPAPAGDETRVGAMPVQGPGREARMQAGQALQSASLGEQFARLPPAVRAGAIGALLLVAGLAFWAFARGHKPQGIQCPDVVTIDDETTGLSFGRGVVDVDCGGKAAFGFNVPPKTKVLFHYLATRISSASELELKLNGHHLGWAPVAAARGEEQVLSLPVEQLRDGGNVVSFVQSKRSNEWSVTRVRVELLAIAPGDLRAAQGAYELGRRKLVERRIAPRNLYDAWKYFVAARRSMEELSPRPPLYDEVAQLIKDAERDMEKECQRMLFSATRSDHYGQQGRAQQIYREVLLHFPGEEPSGCRKKAQESILTTPVGGTE